MTLTIHRHTYTMTRPDGFGLYHQVAWTFEPTAASETTGTVSGITHRRSASEPVAVTGPAFARVERGRLLVEWDDTGWPAEMVASAATRERMGFAWLAK